MKITILVFMQRQMNFNGGWSFNMMLMRVTISVLKDTLIRWLYAIQEIKMKQ